MAMAGSGKAMAGSGKAMAGSGKAMAGLLIIHLKANFKRRQKAWRHNLKQPGQWFESRHLVNAITEWLNELNV